MLTVGYIPEFVRSYKKLEPELQEEVWEKIELFKNPANHRELRVHKLHGKFKDCFSFSVNYRVRVIFTYLQKNKKVAVLLAIGDHEIYR